MEEPLQEENEVVFKVAGVRSGECGSALIWTLEDGVLTIDEDGSGEGSRRMDDYSGDHEMLNMPANTWECSAPLV